MSLLMKIFKKIIEGTILIESDTISSQLNPTIKQFIPSSNEFFENFKGLKKIVEFSPNQSKMFCNIFLFRLQTIRIIFEVLEKNEKIMEKHFSYNCNYKIHELISM